MKKIFCTLLVMVLVLQAWAVDLPKQGFGMQIGWAQPTLRVNDPSAKDSLSHHLQFRGFKVGVIYDGSFAAGFGAAMGLNYTFGVYNSGWKSRNPAYGDYPKDRQLITYNQLEVFVDWQYKFEVAKETYLILYTGPTIQCGLTLDWRKDTKDDITGEVVTVRGDAIDAYKVDPESSVGQNAIKRLNVTWGVGAGFQYQRYFLRGGYDFGLINPYKNSDFANGVHTRGRFDQWEIKIGMYFWYAD